MRPRLTPIDRLRRLAAAVLLSLLCAAPANAQDQSFTIVILGDTQDLTRSDSLLATRLVPMVDWIIANKQIENIQLAIQVGDVILNGSNGSLTDPNKAALEWGRFNSQWHRLGDAGIPTVVVRGNHDDYEGFIRHYGGAAVRQATADDFPLSDPNSGQPLEPVFRYESTFGDPNDGGSHSWIVNLGGREVVVLGLGYRSEQPASGVVDPNEFSWAQQELDRHVEKPAIIASHAITRGDGSHFLGDWIGNLNVKNSIWRDLVEADNNAAQIFLTASGHFVSHFKGIRLVKDLWPVLDTLQDWSADPQPEASTFTLVRYRAPAQTIEVQFFSPAADPNWDPTYFREGAQILAEAPFSVDIPNSDNDPISDRLDNCPLLDNSNQANQDGDDFGDGCDTCPRDPDNDIDGDLLCGDVDVCPLDPNNDGDGDGLCADIDTCPDDPDPTNLSSDSDGLGDVCDNCPTRWNPDQADLDGDEWGDRCDPDIDGDGLLNADDACDFVFDPNNIDSDGDGVGDLCDFCPTIPDVNPEPTDCNGNGNPNDPGESAGEQCDQDGDGVGDACDSCVAVANPRIGPGSGRTTTGGQLDGDADGYGNQCDGKFTPGADDTTDADRAELVASIEVVDPADPLASIKLWFAQNCGLDGDRSCDEFDLDSIALINMGDLAFFDGEQMLGRPPGPKCALCPLTCEGPACNPAAPALPDQDGDGLLDSEDNCPAIPNPGQENSDSDPQGDACDTDDDDDGLPDAEEVAMGTSLILEDTDGDGLDDGWERCFGEGLDPDSPSVDPLADCSFDPYHPAENSSGTDLSPVARDTDGDGDSDLVELVAQVDPLDASVGFWPVLAELGDGSVEVTWATQPAADYEMLFADGLAQAVDGTRTAVLPALVPYAIVAGAPGSATTSDYDDGGLTGTPPSAVSARLYAVSTTGPHPVSGALTTVTGTPAGFVRVNLPSEGYRVIAVPFWPEDPSVHGVLGSQLDGALEEFQADRVMAFDPIAQQYETAFLFDSGGAFPAFDRRFFDLAGESSLTLDCGEALFVHNRGPAQALFLAGRLARHAVHQRFLPAGFSLFAPCYAVERRAPDDTGLDGQGAIGALEPQDADQILRLDPDSQKFVAQFLFDSGGAFPAFDGLWFPKTAAPAESFQLDAGEGYLYRNRGPAELPWAEDRPYLVP